MSTGGSDPVIFELGDLADVTRLLEESGPFASAVLTVPIPGGQPEELATHWHSVRHRLTDLGAPDELLGSVDGLVEQLPPTGRSLYLVVTPAALAYRWLGPAEDGTERATFDTLPDLVPAIAGLGPAEVGIGVAIDHLGADVVVVSDRAVGHSDSVDGRDEHLHLAASGGWSQRRHQAHTRLRWERNAQLVAEDLVALSGEEAPAAVVVTGDERSRGYLLDHLPAAVRELTHVATAGGRSDPDVLDRLVEATGAAVAEVGGRHRRGVLDRLAEELGQHDRAVAGPHDTLAALSARSVETLFVAAGDGDARAWFAPGTDLAATSPADLEASGATPVEGRLPDVAIRSALASGADVTTVDASELPAGTSPPAALLRYS